MVKLMACLKRKPGMSAKEFHRYWKDVHGAMVNNAPEFIRYVRRYVLSRTISHTVPGVPVPPVPYDGVAELWFDSVEDIAKAYSEPVCVETLMPDWDNFFDAQSSLFFIVDEVEM